MPSPTFPDTLVVDASVALKWLLPEPFSEQSLLLLQQPLTLHVPDLLFPEVGNILWKRVRSDEVNPEKASELLVWLSGLPLLVHPSASLMLPALEIACQYQRTVYDSLYLALALQEKCPVVTADEKLLNALSNTPLADAISLIQNF